MWGLAQARPNYASYSEQCQCEHDCRNRMVSPDPESDLSVSHGYENLVFALSLLPSVSQWLHV